MGSLIEELRRREAAARAEADRLRTRIEELAEGLARAVEQATRLPIARKEVTRVLGEPAAADVPTGQDGGQPRETRAGSPIGAVTVLPTAPAPSRATTSTSLILDPSQRPVGCQLPGPGDTFAVCGRCPGLAIPRWIRPPC
jgi:hypothetical protein